MGCFDDEIPGERKQVHARTRSVICTKMKKEILISFH